MFDEITAHLQVYKRFWSSLGAFRRALKRSGIELPRGQASHVLRHTFASHFMMNGGNILVLQKILGHEDIATTMRYAKFDPDHLQDATRLNPLSSNPTRLNPSDSLQKNPVGHFLDTSPKSLIAQP
ncbi:MULTISPECIES: tyrosine-type recombinase/integrase [unclassified Endozoicomonas]|uniref:tyrosine-type recombinase/integrase n=1 Tax=unclassified Endozoicomonas TaxID=2644528 RepID=UPI003BB79E77